MKNTTISIITTREVRGDGSIYIGSSTTYQVFNAEGFSVPDNANLRTIKKALKESGFTSIEIERQTITNNSSRNKISYGKPKYQKVEL